MSNVNMAVWDRILRAIIGIVLIALFFFITDTPWRWAFWIGLIPLITALVGHCPVYRWLGWSTAEKKV